MTVEISDEPPPPPPEGWKRSGCVVSGADACIVEDLLVRGFDEHEVPTILFALVDDRNRQDLSHEEDIAGIVERCREPGITIEVGEVLDETDCVRMDRPFRVFRNGRMIGEGCPWEPDEPFEYAFMVVEAGPAAGCADRNGGRMTENPDREAVTHRGEHTCSFCGKPRHEVKMLVSGRHGVTICNECAELCLDITNERATRALGDDDDDAIVERVYSELDRIGFLTLLARGELGVRLILAHVVKATRHPLVRHIAELEAKIKKQDG